MAEAMRMAAPERKFAKSPIVAVAVDGSFSGYASLFGAVDLGRDVVERGAFAKSLAMTGAAGIRMLFQHDPATPIGVWDDIREDARGLFVKGRLAKGAGRADEILALMRAGAVDGLSIGFRTVRAASDPKRGIRRILEAKLREISVVTFPMLPGARVESVKAIGEACRERRQRVTAAALAALMRRAARSIHPNRNRGKA